MSLFIIYIQSMSINTERIVPKSSSVSSLHILKALAAFIVVSCHSPFALLKNYVTPIQCIAVVIFFMISGYFLYSSDINKILERLKRSILKVFKITILLQVFYCIWIYPNHGFAIKTYDDLFTILFLGGLTSGHLWYLTSFLEALIILYLFFRLKVANKLMMPIALSIFLLPFFSYYRFLASEIIPVIDIYNVFLYALPSIAIGYLLRKKESTLFNINKWGELAILFLILSYIELYILRTYYSSSCSNGIFLFSPFFAISLFMFFIQRKTLGKGSFLEKIGVKHSANIYYFHIAILTLCIKSFYLLGLEHIVESFGVIICFIASLLFSMFLLYLKNLFTYKKNKTL